MHVEFALCNAADGEAASVQPDKAFGQDVWFQFGGQREPKRAVVFALFDARDRRLRDDVAAHHMTADFVTEAGGAFQIHFAAFGKAAQIGFGQSFRHQIEIRFAAANLRDGEAAAVVGDRRADLQIVRHVLGQQDGVGAEIGGGLGDAYDFARALYNACKHDVADVWVGRLIGFAALESSLHVVIKASVQRCVSGGQTIVV